MNNNITLKEVMKDADGSFKGWSVNAKVKFGDTGASGTLPLPLPDGTQIDDYESLNWSLSYSQESVDWDNLLGAVATALSIAGLAALLAWLAGNDASGIGVLDDGAIPGVLALMAELFAKFSQYLPQFSNSVTCGL